MGGPLDEHVGGLRLPGVHDVQIVVLLHLPAAALHPVGVKHQNGHAAAVSGVVAQNVHQPPARPVQIFLRDAVQLLPRKNHVVAVHQQVLRPSQRLGGGLLHRALRPCVQCLTQEFVISAFYFSVGALKDFQQLLVLRQRAPVGGGTAAPGVRLFLLLGLRGGRVPHRQMRLGGHLVPMHQISSPMAAKHRVRGVLGVGVRVVARRGQHFFRVVAGGVPGGLHRPAAQPVGVGGHLPGVATRRGNRNFSRQYGVFPLSQRRVKAAAQLLHIRHGPAHVVGGQRQPEVVPRLQQHGLSPRRRRAQPLPHRPVGGLPEIPALGVLQVRPPRRQRDGHVGQRRAQQHAGMGALRKVGQNQPLPVLRQRVRRAVRRQLHAAAPGRRLQPQMHLGIVAQRLVMPHPRHRFGDAFLI